MGGLWGIDGWIDGNEGSQTHTPDRPVSIQLTTPCVCLSWPPPPPPPNTQVSDEAKQQVSAQAKAEAARMAKEALAARLKEIGMSAGDWALYEGILARVSPQIQQVRAFVCRSGLVSSGVCGMGAHAVLHSISLTYIHTHTQTASADFGRVEGTGQGAGVVAAPGTGGAGRRQARCVCEGVFWLGSEM
jgi:hypothetical protein